MNHEQELALELFHKKQRVSKATADKFKKYLLAEAEAEKPTDTYLLGPKLREEVFDLSHSFTRVYKLSKDGQEQSITVIFYTASKNLQWMSVVFFPEDMAPNRFLDGTWYQICRQPEKMVKRLMNYDTTDIYGALKVEQTKTRLSRLLNKKPVAPVTKAKNLKI